MKKSTIRNRYLQGMGIIVIVLALLRCVFPEIANGEKAVADDAIEDEVAEVAAISEKPVDDESYRQTVYGANLPMRYLSEGEQRHRIRSVKDFLEAFPDTNDLQLTAANRWGVTPVRNRQDAEQRQTQLVYIGSSPYYTVENLTHSIPYLVPRAAILLEDIGRAFFDSLHVKGMPLHRLVVTSVLRTEEDVAKLRRQNKNATEKSCHLYGTTFDIVYIRYNVVDDPDGKPHRASRDDSLKWVLAEVLRDARANERCYIKYEVKQPCFHITVR